MMKQTTTCHLACHLHCFDRSWLLQTKTEDPSISHLLYLHTQNVHTYTTQQPWIHHYDILVENGKLNKTRQVQTGAVIMMQRAANTTVSSSHAHCQTVTATDKCSNSGITAEIVEIEPSKW